MNAFLELIRENECDISCFYTAVDALPHYHSNLEIHYAVDYNFKIIINGEKRELVPGEVVIVNSYDIHSTIGDGTLCVLIPYTFLTGLENYKKSNPLYNKVFFDKEGKIKTIIEQFQNPSLHLLKKKALIYELFAEFYNLDTETSSNEKADKTSVTYPLIRDIINYVNENYTQKITLDTIVDKFKYSKSHVSHSIKKFLDCNLNTFVNSVRLKNFIERMKTEPESKIITIAYDCGFDSLQTFYRNFKDIYKCTPLDYIKRLKNSDI